MNHLVYKDHVSRTLNKLLPIVVGERQDCAYRPKSDATVPSREILPGIRRVFRKPGRGRRRAREGFTARISGRAKATVDIFCSTARKIGFEISESIKRLG